MSEEFIDKIVEDKKQERKKFWIGVLISFVCLLITVGVCIGIYNSDWYINQTMPIKKSEKEYLGKNIKWAYECKYENGALKVFLTVDNIDKKMMDYIYNQFSNNDSMIKLEFQDKDGYKIKTLELPLGDFVGNKDDMEYTVQGRIDMDKKTVRKIKKVNPIYKAVLDKKYDELIKEIQNEYRKAMRSAFGGLFGY